MLAFVCIVGFVCGLLFGFIKGAECAGRSIAVRMTPEERKAFRAVLDRPKPKRRG